MADLKTSPATSRCYATSFRMRSNEHGQLSITNLILFDANQESQLYREFQDCFVPTTKGKLDKEFTTKQFEYWHLNANRLIPHKKQ
jgi:hypothetical protein